MRRNFFIIAFSPHPLRKNMATVRQTARQLRAHLEKGIFCPQSIKLIVCSSESWVRRVVEVFKEELGVNTSNYVVIIRNDFETIFFSKHRRRCRAALRKAMFEVLVYAENIDSEVILFFPGRGVISSFVKTIPLQRGWWRTYVRGRHGTERWIRKEVSAIGLEEAVGIELWFDTTNGCVQIVSLTFFKYFLGP